MKTVTTKKGKINILKRIKATVLAGSMIGTIIAGASLSGCQQKKYDTKEESRIISLDDKKNHFNIDFITITDNFNPTEKLQEDLYNKKHIALIIKNTVLSHNTIFNSINNVKKLIQKYHIDAPILLDIDSLYENTVEYEVIKEAKIFIEKLSLNGCYAGLYGSEENLEKLSQEGLSFDALVTTNYNKNDIPESIPYNMVQTKNGEIVFKANPITIIKTNNLNDFKNFVPDLSYTVQEGDTLESIANKFNTQVDIIKYLNNIENASEIYPGEVIIFPHIYDTPTFTSGDCINSNKKQKSQ